MREKFSHSACSFSAHPDRTARHCRWLAPEAARSRGRSATRRSIAFRAARQDQNVTEMENTAVMTNAIQKWGSMTSKTLTSITA